MAALKSSKSSVFILGVASPVNDKEQNSACVVNHTETIFTRLNMKKLYLYLISLFVLSGVLLAACSGGASNSLVGTWRLVSYGSPGNLTPAAPDVDTSIVFTEDGKVEGNVGCNGFGGDYTVEGNTITFGPIVSTLMLCEGPVGDQETTTLNVLVETVTFVMEGDTVTITSADGSSVIVLERK
jgi:heat shock protein HslJ